MLSFVTKNRQFNKVLVNRGSALVTQQVLRTTVARENYDEYQYIQRSELPTFHFQQCLPRLPVPALQRTCDRYINAQKPLLSNKQILHTTSAVTKFLEKEGIKLHTELVERDSKNSHTSYISEPWFDMYLRDRKPLPINYNPFLVFVPEPSSQYNTQLVKTTNLIISAMRFVKSLRAGILEPEVYHMNSKKSDTKLFRTVTGLLPNIIRWYGAYAFKAFPLDMSQYQNLFCTTRIPQQEKDKIYYDESGRHVVIIRKGHFYAFNVLDDNGDIVAPKEIASRLKAILEDNRPRNEYPIGLFSTMERNKWANIRSHLIKLGNEEAFRKIDSAVFIVNLDDEDTGDNYNKLVRTYLHGDGENRWFDKSFSFIVTKDGHAGLNFEHSWGDGVAVLRFFKDIKKDITEKPRFHPEEVNNLQQNVTGIQKIDINIDAGIKEAIDQQRKEYRNWIDTLCVDHVIYEGLGQSQCKKLKVSPDAIMQLGFQLALYLLEGKAVPTYESCSTAMFKHGRTETIRSCTVETQAVCAAMAKDINESSIPQIRKMIEACSKAHKTLTMQAAMGQGFDRHLFALKKIWEKSGTPIPALFDDPAYKALNHNILSTSTLSNPAVSAGGFGPVELDGYGIAYMIQDKRLGAVVTSYQGSRNATDYVRSLEHAIKKIHRVLTE